MNSVSEKTFTLPSVGAEDDGFRITLSKISTGKLNIQTADSDKIAQSTAGGTIYNDDATELYYNITLEYVNATLTWNILAAHGSWVTT